MPSKSTRAAIARASPEPSRQLTLFISYSRSDMELADRLVAALEGEEFRCLIDRRDLKYGEKWRGVLREFIAEADTIVFLVSPRSIVSQWCRWEAMEVAKLAKRLVPVVIEPVPNDALPPEIADWHLMPFDTSGDFDGQLRAIVDTLRADRPWIVEHTRLSLLAASWNSNDRHQDRLLQGDALAAAEDWKSKPRKNDLRPDPLVEAYISESRAAAVRRARRRTRLSFAIALGAILLAAVAAWQSLVATNNARIADEQRKIAQESERAAQAALAAEKEARAAEAARRKEIEEIGNLADTNPNFRIPTFKDYTNKHTAWIELSMPQEAREFEYSVLVLEGKALLASDYSSIPYVSKNSFTALNRSIVLGGGRARFELCATYFDTVAKKYVRYRRSFDEDARVAASDGKTANAMQPAISDGPPRIESASQRLSCLEQLESAGVPTSGLERPAWHSSPPLSSEVPSGTQGASTLPPGSDTDLPADAGAEAASRVKALFAGDVNLGFSVWREQGEGTAHALCTIGSTVEASDVTYRVMVTDKSGQRRVWQGELAALNPNEHYSPTGEDGVAANTISAGELEARVCMAFRDKRTGQYIRKEAELVRSAQQVARQQLDTTPMDLVQQAPPSFEISSETLSCLKDSGEGNMADAAAAAEPQTPVVESKSGPPATIPSAWLHNGLPMRTATKGKRITIRYLTPQTGAGSDAGSNRLLFDGIVEGNEITGNARIFQSGCQPAIFAATGALSDDKRRIALRGTAPRLSVDCSVLDRGHQELILEAAEP